MIEKVTLYSNNLNTCNPTWINPDGCNKELTALETIQVFTDNNQLIFGDREDFIGIPIHICDNANYDVYAELYWFLCNNSDAIYFMNKNNISARELINLIMQEVNNKNHVKTQELKNEKENNEGKPFIVIYRSKPIKGIRLELIGKNPNYNFRKNEECPSNTNQTMSKLVQTINKCGFSITHLRLKRRRC